MLKKFHAYYVKQTFAPGFFSIFINPFFFIRRALMKSISNYTPLLTGKMLDFGCGTKPYRSLFTQVQQYIGLDMENEGHSHEKEQIDVYYDGKHIPFDNNYFDSLFCSEVFEHIFNINEIIPEIHRVLKKDAKVLITVPFAWDEHEIPNDFGRYTVFGLTALLEKHGFQVETTEKSGHFVQVIAQFITLYIRHKIFSNNKYLNILLNVIFIAPFTLKGIILSFILPKHKSLYFNTILVAHKI